jgi:hypothetical protein
MSQLLMEAKLKVMKTSEGNSTLTHKYIEVMVKENGRWLISDIRTYMLMEKSERHLKGCV